MGHGPTKYESLTQHEKEVIKEYWGRLRGRLSKCGLQLFSLLLEAHPEYSSLFDFRYEEEKLENHGLKVLREFSLVINNLDTTAQVLYILEQNARSHAQFRIGKATYDHFREAFLKMLNEQFGNDKKLPEIQTIWNKGLDLMFTIILDLMPKWSFKPSDETV